jgi:hypothetical protein
MNIPRRFAGISGLVFVILSVAVAVTAPPLPSVAATGSNVLAYFTNNQGGVLIGNYLGAVALLPGFIITLYVVLAIRDAEPGRGYIWLLALVTNTASIAAAVVVFILFQTAAVVAKGSPSELALALSDAAAISFAMFFVPQAAGVASVAWGVQRTGVLPRWIAWFGWLVVVAMLVASFGVIVLTEPLAAGGIVTALAFGLFAVWFLAISITLLLPPAPAPVAP